MTKLYGMDLLIICLTCAAIAFSQVEDAPQLHMQLVFSIGVQGIEPGQLLYPMAISVDPKGNVYVADTGNNRIQKFDPHGKLLTFIGGFGWDSEQFQQPVDICADNGLDVYVADYDNRRLERYDKDLNWISSFYSEETQTDELQFGFISGVAISIHSELFMVDDENNRVLKLNTQWEPELSFGDFDWGEGKLDQPSRVAVGRDDKVYISDQAAHRVVVFDYYGNYLTHWGDEELSQPRGLCVTPSGYLFVTDWEAHRVVVFDGHGRLVAKWGNKGDKLGAFNHPVDVACNKDKLFIADHDNHRIQVFAFRISRHR